MTFAALCRLWVAVFVLAGVCGPAAAAICTTGQAAWSTTVSGYSGSGASAQEACTAALLATAGSYVGGSATVSGSNCTLAKSDGSGQRSGSLAGPSCELYADTLQSVVDKLEEVRLAVVASGSGGGGTISAVISSDGVLNVDDAATRSVLIAAFCVSIVALGFIGGNLA